MRAHPGFGVQTLDLRWRTNFARDCSAERWWVDHEVLLADLPRTPIFTRGSQRGALYEPKYVSQVVLWRMSGRGQL